MKKLLLGTTALVGASVVAGSALAVPLQSQDEDGTQVLTAGMVSQWEVGAASNDNYTGSANTSDHGMINGRFAEIWMNGELTADNGLVYGATIHMATGGVNTNGWPGREYIFMNGGWGSLEFGDNFHADSGMALCPTCRTYAGANGGIDAGLRYIAMPAGAADGGGAAASGIRARAGAPYRQWFAQGTGVTYYTPIVSGFQAGITYAPNTSDNAVNAVDNAAGVYKDKIGFGGQWKGDFGDVNVGLSAVGAVSDGYLSAATGTTGLNNEKDVNGLGMYMLSAQIGWGSFQVGGQYYDEGTSGAIKGRDFGFKSDGWGLDAAYWAGPLSFEVQYVSTEVVSSNRVVTAAAALAHATTGVTTGFTVAPSALGETYEVDIWTIGSNYQVAPGLSWYTGIQGVDIDHTQNATDLATNGAANLDNDAIAVFSGLQMSF